VGEFWEIGAGRALSGMIRRISKDALCRAVGSVAEVRAAVAGKGTAGQGEAG
jgi:[acyl-carrier-protein] S-malonyltransferase